MWIWLDGMKGRYILRTYRENYANCAKEVGKRIEVSWPRMKETRHEAIE
jgi:hypothetical protein